MSMADALPETHRDSNSGLCSGLNLGAAAQIDTELVVKI
jgi:hypothetical protein